MPDVNVRGREFGREGRNGNGNGNVDYKTVKWEQHRLSLWERDRRMREGGCGGERSTDGIGRAGRGEDEGVGKRRSSRKSSCEDCECKDRFLNSVRASFESRSGNVGGEHWGSVGVAERSERYDIFVDECERGFFGEGEVLC